jgi:hypothetical protein
LLFSLSKCRIQKEAKEIIKIKMRVLFLFFLS